MSYEYSKKIVEQVILLLVIIINDSNVKIGETSTSYSKFGLWRSSRNIVMAFGLSHGCSEE